MQSDQLHVPADFSHIMLRDGSWLTREPPCRFLQLGLFHVRLSQSVLLHFLTFSQHSERAWGFPSNTFSNFFRWLICFLHVRYIPLHNSRWPFWASVILMSARKGDMSPSGNTCLGNNLNFLPDLWVQTFYGSTLSTESATVGLFFASHSVGRSVEQRTAVPGFTIFSDRRHIAWCEVFSFHFARETDRCQLHFAFTTWRGTGHAFRYGDFFFVWSLVRLNCAPKSSNTSAVYGVVIWPRRASSLFTKFARHVVDISFHQLVPIGP